jgi:ATP-dependent DNA ligase
MEALATGDIPEGAEWQYEPKWDGFRCLAFRDGASVELQSKAGQPLARYFPEMVAAFQEVPGKRFVLDGEIVVPVGRQLSFEELLMRIHPAESRIRKLSAEHPALYLAFDLLVDARGKLLVDAPLAERRRKLEEFAAEFLTGSARIKLSPYTTALATARRWFRTMGGSLDGIIAKNRELPYQSGERTGGFRKIKNLRTADCVAGGFRYASAGKVVGSLLLGLYDDQGLLNHVGFTSSIQRNEKKALTAKLESLIEPPGFTGSAPGGPSRWSTERSAEWQPLAPKLVVEVQYDHFSGGRFRHGTKLLRFRPDKAPRQCTLAQVQQESRSPLTLL